MNNKLPADARIILADSTIIEYRWTWEISDLHSFKRKSYEIECSDGFKTQQYEIGRIRQILSRRYGVTQKFLKENGI